MIDYDNETTITEITIQPDGRVFIFGTSRQVIDLLVELDPSSLRLRALLNQVAAHERESELAGVISGRSH